MGKRARLLVLCVAFGVLPQAAPLRAGPPPARSVVWVIDSSFRADPTWAGGLWHISSDGSREKILGRRWRPLAPSSDGPIAAVPSENDGRRRYWIVRPNGSDIRLPHATEGPPCAAWSRNGDLLAYLAGDSATSLGTEGTLWVASRKNPSTPVLVATGRFPECPVWSPVSRRLAFLRVDGDRWNVEVYDGETIDKIDNVADTTTASGGASTHRSLDWSPSGDMLAWVAGRSIRMWKDGTTGQLTEAGALAPVIRRSEGHGWRRLRFSPDGSLLGVGIGYGAGIFQADGDPVTFARGILRGWAGNAGILTARSYRGIPSLLLYRAVADAAPERIQKYSKMPVVTDPRAEWFAYLNPDVDRLVFRRPRGRLIRKVDVSNLRPGTPGAEAPNGRFSVPPWP